MDDEKSEGTNEIIEEVGEFTAAGATVRLTVARWTDAKGVAFPPTLRLVRQTGKKPRGMSSFKSAEEIDGVLKLLPKGKEALAKALLATK